MGAVKTIDPTCIVCHNCIIVVAAHGNMQFVVVAQLTFTCRILRQAHSKSGNVPGNVVGGIA